MAHRVLALVIVVLSVVPAAALDCTPIGTVATDGTVSFGVIGQDAVPGEVVCSQDYTGQDLHVWEFTLTAPSVVGFALATGGQSFGQPFPHAEMAVLASCDPNACLAYFPEPTGGVSPATECLAAGTYTIVVASDEANGVHNYAVGVIVLDSCEPVADDESTWSGLKARF